MMQMLAAWVAQVGEAIGLVRWFFRKWFWVGLAWFKAAVNKPLVIPVPQAGRPRIVPVPMSKAIPGLEIEHILVCPEEQIPADERVRSRSAFYKLQVWLYTHYSPMQPGLPSITADPDKALKRAFTWLHRRVLGGPLLPAEFLASPELGALAVRGPYAAYTKKCADTEGAWEWDLMSLARYEHHAGLRRLGVKVRFERVTSQRTLRAVSIECETGRFCPGEAGWELARELALCSVTTHMALVRHFNAVHLAGSSPLSMATRNCLPVEHPLLRLLWPYIYATHQSNHVVASGQMLPGGDFETIFSFTFSGMCGLFDESFREIDFGMNDPELDAQARGVLQQGFDTPTETNLATLFGVMLDHARDYLGMYYPHAAPGVTTSTHGDGTAGLRSDTSLCAWLDELNRLVPNGVGVTSASVDFDSLARLVARCIYLAAVQHEIAGSFLWNYQLWPHRQPVRVYASGQRMPLDVYQRLVNADYNLNVHRRGLIDDFGYLALDDLGAASMQRFAQRLQALQQDMEAKPWAVWKLYPRVLKVNINA
jgi:hypothetical protein